MRLDAQIPTNCFEIESILVDACGAGGVEGLNEMVIFQVGPTALNTANMTGSWPNTSNLWGNICQNGTTAAKVAAINATITACGRIVEPVGGVLPAGKRVLLIPSQTFDQTLHSFVNLNDTLIAIFQCTNNAAGNFANAGVGLRTLTLNFSAPVGCTDVVTYDRSLLFGGNGATVNFCWNGAATYVNNGCTAPFFQLSTNAGAAQSVCVGSSVNLVGTASSCNHRVKWFGGLGTFSNPNALTTTYTPAPGEVGVVNLTLGQFTSCDTAISTVAITVNPRPVFNLPTDSAFCGNFSYTFGPNISGSSYAWSTGATTQNITATGPGIYTLTLTNANGCTNTDAITLNSTTLGNVGLPNDTSVCPGGSITISPTLAGASWIWSTGSIASSINVSTPGIYTLSMLTAGNCLGRDTFVLGNYPLPTLNLGNDTTICPGNGFSLNADPLALNPGATFAWSTGGTSVSISVPGQGSYVVTVTSAQGCVRIDTLVVSESLAPALNLGVDTAICLGASLLLNAGTATSYNWSTSASTQTISVNQPGSYSVTVTYGVNCGSVDTINVQVNALPVVDLGNDTLYCPSTGLSLDAGAGGTYAWNTTATTQQLSLLTGGIYSVTVTNAAQCAAADTIVVQTGTEPQVNLGPNVRLCPGSSVTLDAGAGNASYLWNTTDTTQAITVSAAGLYYVLGTTSCGTDSAAINVTVSPAPFVNAGPDDTLCAGDAVALASATGGGASFLWTSSSGTFSPANSLNAIYTADSTASGPVLLILTVTDTCGTLSDTMVMEILPALSMTIILPDTVCYQTPIQISYVGNPTSVLWIGNGTFSDTSGTPTVYTPAPGEAGQIFISAQATGQCGSRVFTTSFYAEDTVIANFSWQPSIIYPATWVNFNNQTFLPNLPGHWSFGDGFYSLDHDPSHQYYNPGTYDVQLISYGAGGCNDTLVLSLTVIQPDTLIPNVFSPNGDGINDVFDVKVPPTESYSLTIFDRWGRQLFASTDPNSKWNGKLADADVPEGVYYYVIAMKPIAGAILRYNGPVTLLR